MESANSDRWRIRQAASSDIKAIGHLLGLAGLSHFHADWHLPVDWIGTPGFVLCEGVRTGGAEAELIGCLAVGADPPPAAWVRVAALKSGAKASHCLQKMFESTLPWLRRIGVCTLGWLPTQMWPPGLISDLGFSIVNQIITYDLSNFQAPDISHEGFTVMPADVGDLPGLALIEKRAFDPLWRHSAEGLFQAYQQALSFEKANIDGRIAGFQYSVAGQDGLSAHLVRLTVSPEYQGRGIGSGLMASALLGFARRGFRRATLNTQQDNFASRRLYERFGFRQLDDRLPVWAMEVAGSTS